MRAPTILRTFVVLGALLLLAGCGNSTDTAEETAKADRDNEVETSEDDTRHDGEEDEQGEEGEEGEPTAMPEPVPAGEQPPILVTAPAPFEQLVGSFILRGSAQVHEGALVWAILDARLRPMATGRMSATCGAPCRGRFSTRISLANVPIGSWELHVWSPNVADEGPERLHDTMVPVTVSDRKTPGAPQPGTVPPGGPPQS